MAGYSAWDRLGFDLAVNEFGERFDSAQQATKEVPDSAKKKRTRTKIVPKYTKEQLNGFLSIPLHLVRSGEAWGDDPDVQELASEIRSGTADWLMNPQPLEEED